MTNTDILFLVGTCAVIFLTGFLCMALYYAICILRRVNKTLDLAEEKFELLFNSWNEFHSRLLGLRTSLDLIANGCRAALSLYQRRMTKDDDESDGSDTEKLPHTRKGKKRT